MDNIITSLFTITLFPFTSGTDFVVLPCIMSFVTGLMLLVSRMIRGKYRCS